MATKRALLEAPFGYATHFPLVAFSNLPLGIISEKKSRRSVEEEDGSGVLKVERHVDGSRKEKKIC